MNPDHTILCHKCHQPVVRAETMQGLVVLLETKETIYVYAQQGARLRAQRIQQAGMRHRCPQDHETQTTAH